MNKVVLMGRLTADPDVKAYDSGKFARFNMAIDRSYKDKNGNTPTDFIPIFASGNRAEFAEKYLKKGMKILLEGMIETSSYKAKNGETKYSWGVRANSFEFAESKKATSNTNSQSRQADTSFMNMPENADDEGLPFN